MRSQAKSSTYILRDQVTTTEKVDEKCLSTWQSKKNEINFTNEKKALIFGFDDGSAFCNALVMLEALVGFLKTVKSKILVLLFKILQLLKNHQKWPKDLEENVGIHIVYFVLKSSYQFQSWLRS